MPAIPRKMPALRFRDKVSLDEVEVPAPKPGEALIEVIRAGICATDLEIVRGYMGFAGTLGHEFVGRIVAIEPETPVSKSRLPDRLTEAAVIGDRVVGEINLPCRTCSVCTRGDGNHCPRRSVLGILDKDGVFATHLTLPLQSLHLVPDQIPDRSAAFVEPLAAALRILEQVEIEPDTAVLVIGDGKLGLLCGLVLDATGAAVTAVGRHEAKLELLRARGIATMSPFELEKAGRRFDVVVEASGSPAGWESAIANVRPRGTVILKTTCHGSSDWNSAPLVIDEITVVGSRCGPFRSALEWLESGRIDPLPLLSEEFPLLEGMRALEVAGSSGALKIQIVP